jgi:hypothetical protein
MRFGRTGAANGVYIIYDFYPKEDNPEREMRIEDEYSGYLSGDQRFFLAKIADDINELNFRYTFDLREMVDHPVQLVRAVKTADGSIIRATTA